MHRINLPIKRSVVVSVLFGLFSSSTWAENIQIDEPNADASATAIEKQYWVDEQHGSAKTGINKLAGHVNSWFGTPDPSRPASANLRIILDTEWNKYDDFKVKPRVRGKVKLPVLQERLSVVLGDDSLDNQLDDNTLIPHDASNEGRAKTYDARKNREQNSSLALRLSEFNKRADIKADLDLGIRSGDDIYIRAKAGKTWQLEDDYTTSAEQIYRYGLDSKHYVRTNLEVRKSPAGQPFIANQFHLQYTNDNEEDWKWGNNLYRQHEFEGNKWVNYGVYAGGYIENKKADLNSYGPFVGARQPFLREWLFVQTELNYYNDRKENRKHHVGALLRFEALF